MKKISFVVFTAIFVLICSKLFAESGNDVDCNKYCSANYSGINNVNACKKGCAYGVKLTSECKNTEYTTNLSKDKAKGANVAPIGADEMKAAKEAIQALEALQSVVSSGVSYRDYGPRKADTRIIVDRFLNEYKENPVADAIAEAMAHYEAAGSFWKIYFSDNGMTHRNNILLSDETEVKYYLNLYPEIKTKMDEIMSQLNEKESHYVSLSVALSVIWGKAGEAINKARSILK